MTIVHGRDRPPSGSPSEPSPGSNPARWRWLLVVCLLLVTHGSLYPWHIDRSVSFASSWTLMWSQAGWWSSLGDVVGNVVLFVPVGLLAMRALDRDRSITWTAVALIGTFGIAFALALQVLQFWVPERSAAVSDVLWNAVGLAIGQALAMAWQRLGSRRGAADAFTASPGMVMALLWLAVEWWPFLPTIDFQHVKDALKPLLLTPHWNLRSFVEAGLSLLVVAQLTRTLRQRGAVMLGLVVAAGFGKLFLAAQVLSAPHVAGWLVGLAVAPVVWRMPQRSAHALVAAMALAYFTWDELRPFAWQSEASRFSWIPFVASLRGSLIVNTLALCWQAFWIGAVMFTGRGLGLRAGALAVGVAIWALLLELQQAWLPGRVADVTPAVLPLLWWLVMPMCGVVATPGGSTVEPTPRPI